MKKLMCTFAILAAAASTAAVAGELKQDKKATAPTVAATQMSDSEMDKVTAGDAGLGLLTAGDVGRALTSPGIVGPPPGQDTADGAGGLGQKHPTLSADPAIAYYPPGIGRCTARLTTC